MCNTHVLDDNVRHVCDTCFDKGKTESCYVEIFRNSFFARGVRSSADFSLTPCLFLQLARSDAVLPAYDFVERHEHELPSHLPLFFQNVPHVHHNDSVHPRSLITW